MVRLCYPTNIPFVSNCPNRKDPVPAKSAFAVRPECAWTIHGVEDSGSGKRAVGAVSGSSSATLLEGTATRQLRRCVTITSREELLVHTQKGWKKIAFACP